MSKRRKQQTAKQTRKSESSLSDAPSPRKERSAKLGIGCFVVLLIGFAFAAVMEMTTGEEAEDAPPVEASP